VRTLLCALAFAAAASCEAPGRSRPKPKTHLEQSLFLAERDMRGGEHPISSKTQAGEVVERTADGATLDVNSQLQVRIQDALAGPEPGILAPAEAAALSEDIRTLTGALNNLAKIRELEEAALRAWQRYQADPAADAESATFAAFDLSRKALARAENDGILEPVRRLWPMAERAAVDADVIGLLSGDAAAQERVATQLRAKLEDLSRRSGEFQRGVRERGEADQRRLRIEAFLIPASGSEKSHAVHVPGYDDLDEGEVQRIDPFGLRLTHAEREALETLTTDSRALAVALERVRTGEATLGRAIAEASGPLFEGLQRLQRDIATLDLGKLDERASRTRAALEEFATQLATAAQALAEEKRAQWSTDLTAFLQETEALRELVAQFTELAQLADEWKAAAAAQFPDLAARTLAALGKLDKAWENRQELLDGASGLLTAIGGSIQGLSEDARLLAEPIWARSRLKGELEEWRVLLERIGGLVGRLGGALGLLNKPVRTDLQNPGVIDLPIGEARDTHIDLRKTTRMRGDSLHVRVRLLAPGSDTQDAEPPFEATFGLRKLGWHADLVPSVVFVEGDRVSGANDSGGFSTSLGWLWGYGPRDDQKDPYLSRSLGWSAGLHATFLNFGPDNDAEIGLGATLGFWDQRILVGMGYNALADSDGDGRVYYFLGSSLVPLLQALAREDG
jgi:hypothetical protein